MLHINLQNPKMTGATLLHTTRALLQERSTRKVQMGVSLNMNIIPPMTDAHGKYWVQPDPRGFVLDDNYVLMEKLDFDLLPDYTNSEPTGKYNGKMWKGRFQTLKGEKWFLMWCHDENKLSNQIYISSREILVL